ncbi:MAG: NPXTG-anchored protein [Oscillospiraceae bacterium]|nr:NPXTG-anchored protein [Oscillospiraceae bacterium]
MKLRRILAASTAAAIVASAMSIVSFAESNTFSGTAAVKSTGSWWDTYEATMEELIGDLDPASVTSISITTDNAAKFLYNFSATEDARTVDIAAGETITVTDVLLDSEFYWSAFAVSTDDTNYVANFQWTATTEVATDDTDDTTTDGDEIVDGDDATGDDVISMEKPIVIDNDVVGGDWGGDATIDYTVLEQFEGDVLVTLDVALTVDDAHTYWMVAPANYWGWEKIAVTIPDDTAYFQQADGFINITDNTATQVQFVLGAADVEALLSAVTADETTGELAGGLLFQVYGADVTSVTLDDYVPASDDGAAEGGDSAGNTDGADDENKNSADTGVEGIAVAAGALALAGAAVIASRKRK